MTEGEFDLEELAAFIDGKLTGEERARVVKLLAESDAAYEVFTETVRYRFGEADDPKVVPLRAWRRLPRPTWKVLVPAAAAAVLLLVVGRPLLVRGPTPLDFSAEPLVAGLTERTDITSSLPEGWDQPGWSVTRGGISRLVEPERAFRLGVRTVDLQVAILSGNAQLADSFISDMVQWLGEVELSQPVVARYASFRPRLASGEAPASVIPDLTAVESALDEFLASDHFDLGKWYEAARLSVVFRDPTFFQFEPTTRFLAALDDYDLSQPDVEALGRIRDLTRNGLDEVEYSELQALLQEGIRRNGG